MVEILKTRKWFILMKLFEFPVSLTTLFRSPFTTIDLITLLEYPELVHKQRLRTFVLGAVASDLLAEEVWRDLILIY